MTEIDKRAQIEEEELIVEGEEGDVLEGEEVVEGQSETEESSKESSEESSERPLFNRGGLLGALRAATGLSHPGDPTAASAAPAAAPRGDL